MKKLLSTKKAHTMILDFIANDYSNLSNKTTVFTTVVNAIDDKLGSKRFPKDRLIGNYCVDGCYCLVGGIAKLFGLDVKPLTHPSDVDGVIKSKINDSSVMVNTSLRTMANINDALDPDKYTIREIWNFVYWLANSMDHIAVKWRDGVKISTLQNQIELGVKN